MKATRYAILTAHLHEVETGHRFSAWPLLTNPITTWITTLHRYLDCYLHHCLGYYRAHLHEVEAVTDSPHAHVYQVRLKQQKDHVALQLVALTGAGRAKLSDTREADTREGTRASGESRAGGAGAVAARAQ